MLLVCSFATVRADGKALIVERQNGTKTTFILAEQPELTFADKALHISVSGKSTDFEIGDVKQFYFGDAATDIAAPQADGLRVVCQSDDKIVIEGVGAHAVVQLFALNGTRLTGHASVADGRAEVTLTSLPKGIYLIKINQQTFKIYRK